MEEWQAKRSPVKSKLNRGKRDYAHSNVGFFYDSLNAIASAY